MLFLLLMGCLYDKDRLDWVYTQLEDDDGDGYREIDGDCDDTSFAVHPGVDEICDGLDNDCNGDADGDALDIRAWFQDRDQDGYGNDDVSRLSCDPVPTYSEENGDCDDDDADVHPDAEVICGEPGDRNCDGVPEDEDLDQDGWARCEDCDDLERTVNPGEVEVCNEYDDNCDGQIDEVGALETTWYPDADGDGYGDPEGAVVSCARPQGYTFDGGDCDDHDNDINPGESEVCGNGADDNCNGAADGCRLEGELELGASFVGVEGMGIGYGSLASVLNAGDTNGDGYQDLLFAERGQVLVQPGPFLGTDVPVTTGATFVATDPGGDLGAFVSLVGDITGDGLDDVLVSNLEATNGLGSGMFLLDRSAQGAMSFEEQDFISVVVDENLGGLSAARGAVGPSGEDLLLVTCWEADINDGPAGISHGSVYETSIPISQGTSPTFDVMVRGVPGSGITPIFLEAERDLDGDGVMDLTVLSVNYSGDSSISVEIDVFRGPVANQQMDASDVHMEGGFGFGGPELDVGDFDGDGALDIALLGLNDNNVTDDGAVWIVELDQSGLVEDQAFSRIQGGPVDDAVKDLTSASIDGDDTDDLLVGFDRALVFNQYDGWAGLYHGPFSGVVAASDYDARVLGSAEFSKTGTVVLMEDYNGNGFIDLFVASQGANAETSRGAFFFDEL